MRGSPWIAGPKKRKSKDFETLYVFYVPTYKDWVSHNLLMIDRLVFVALMVDWLLSVQRAQQYGNSQIYFHLIWPSQNRLAYIVISVSETVHGLSGKYGRSKDTFACSCAYLLSLVIKSVYKYSWWLLLQDSKINNNWLLWQ